MRFEFVRKRTVFLRRDDSFRFSTLEQKIESFCRRAGRTTWSVEKRVLNVFPPSPLASLARRRRAMLAAAVERLG